VSFQLSAAVVAFAESYVGSVDELAALMAVAESSRWWDAPMLARELGILPATARRLLDQFVARGLLDIRVTDDVRYQFRPTSPELDNTVLALADAYRRHPAAVIRTVLGKSRDRSARDFADAFRIRRDDTS
jgi:DNA-binding IclR family transcriptional regulator